MPSCPVRDCLSGVEAAAGGDVGVGLDEGAGVGEIEVMSIKKSSFSG